MSHGCRDGGAQGPEPPKNFISLLFIKLFITVLDMISSFYNTFSWVESARQEHANLSATHTINKLSEEIVGTISISSTNITL